MLTRLNSTAIIQLNMTVDIKPGSGTRRFSAEELKGASLIGQEDSKGEFSRHASNPTADLKPGELRYRETGEGRVRVQLGTHEYELADTDQIN